MHCIKFMLIAASVVFFFSSGTVVAQNEDLLSGSKARELYRQIIDLMEVNSIATPKLARAGAPLIENVHQAVAALAVGNTREHSEIQYQLLTNARIYLQIADAVPKSRSLLDEITEQLISLRHAIDELELHFRATLQFKEKLVLGSDRDQLLRYAENNSQVHGVGVERNRVVFLGDSITDNWALNQYFPGKPYINRGISGQITSQMLARMQADVIDLRPIVLVILSGTNDLARGVPLSTIKNNLSMIASLALTYDIIPIFSSILPVNDYYERNDPDYVRSVLRSPNDITLLNQWIRNFCHKRGLRYLDYHSKMIDSTEQLRVDWTEDGLHPNEEGYKIMASLVQASITSALGVQNKKKRKKMRRLF